MPACRAFWRRGTAPDPGKRRFAHFTQAAAVSATPLYLRARSVPKYFNLLFVVTQTLARRHYIGCWFLVAGYKADWCGIPPFFLRILLAALSLTFQIFPRILHEPQSKSLSRFALQMAHFTLFSKWPLCNAVATTYLNYKKINMPRPDIYFGISSCCFNQSIAQALGLHFSTSAAAPEALLPGTARGLPGFLISGILFFKSSMLCPQATSAMRGERRNCAAIKLVLFPIKVNTRASACCSTSLGSPGKSRRTHRYWEFLSLLQDARSASVPFGLPCQGIIIIGIWRGCLNADYIAANLVVNHIGHFLVLPLSE